MKKKNDYDLSLINETLTLKGMSRIYTKINVEWAYNVLQID